MIAGELYSEFLDSKFLSTFYPRCIMPDAIARTDSHRCRRPAVVSPSVSARSQFTVIVDAILPAPSSPRNSPRGRIFSVFADVARFRIGSSDRRRPVPVVVFCLFRTASRYRKPGAVSPRQIHRTEAPANDRASSEDTYPTTIVLRRSDRLPLAKFLDRSPARSPPEAHVSDRHPNVESIARHPKTSTLIYMCHRGFF